MAVLTFVILALAVVGSAERLSVDLDAEENRTQGVKSSLSGLVEQKRQSVNKNVSTLQVSQHQNRRKADTIVRAVMNTKGAALRVSPMWGLQSLGSPATPSEKQSEIPAMMPPDAVSHFRETQMVKLQALEQELTQKVDQRQAGLLTEIAESPTLSALAGGIGAPVGNTGSRRFDQELVQRIQFQDLVVILLLTFVYLTTLLFSACLAHRQAYNNSPVKYYADPRRFDEIVDESSVEAFLEAFNQPPKSALLKVSGYLPVRPATLGSFFWKGQHFITSFAFSLDLSPWVRRSRLNSNEQSGAEDAKDGIRAEDISKLSNFLSTDVNDLATVEMLKVIEWDNWEELAFNLKHQIHQCGFKGVIQIERVEVEQMIVYKNEQWANFLHGKKLKVILALSVLGWFIYWPYMRFRAAQLTIHCKHHIAIQISDYWNLIVDKLSANGFNLPSAQYPGHFPTQVQSEIETEVSGSETPSTDDFS